jgi:hypothetical protein
MNENWGRQPPPPPSSAKPRQKALRQGKLLELFQMTR